MKRILSLFAVVLLATVALAKAPEEGVDYKWTKISSSMTEIPADFCEGVTKEDAKAYMSNSWSAEMALYGNIPAADGKFDAICINDDWEAVEDSVTWAAAVENGSAFYPRKIEPQAYEWVVITSEMTSLPSDFYAGVTEADAKAYMNENYSVLGCLIGNVPAEGEEFDAVILNTSYEYEVVKMSWTSAVSKYDAEWGDGVVYPRTLTTTAVSEVRKAETQKTGKRLENGKIVIIKNGKKFNVNGQMIR